MKPLLYYRSGIKRNLLRHKTCRRFSTPSMLDVYGTNVKSGILTHDAQQHKTLKLFHRLLKVVERNSLLPPESAVRLKGVYLHGGVGTGKTMLMDMFLAQIQQSQQTNRLESESVPTVSARRVHFHEFMQEVKQLIRTFETLLEPHTPHIHPLMQSKNHDCRKPHCYATFLTTPQHCTPCAIHIHVYTYTRVLPAYQL